MNGEPSGNFDDDVARDDDEDDDDDDDDGTRIFDYGLDNWGDDGHVAAVLRPVLLLSP